MELPFSSPVAGSKLAWAAPGFCPSRFTLTFALWFSSCSQPVMSTVGMLMQAHSGKTVFHIYSFTLLTSNFGWRTPHRPCRSFLAQHCNQILFTNSPSPSLFLHRLSYLHFFFFHWHLPPDKFVAYYCRLNNAPWRCLCPNSPDLWMCYFTWHKGLYRCDYIKNWGMEDDPGLSGWTQCSH